MWVLRIRAGHRIIERARNIQASLHLNAAPSKDGTPYPGTPRAEKGVTHGITLLAGGSLVSRPGDWSGFEKLCRLEIRDTSCGDGAQAGGMAALPGAVGSVVSVKPIENRRSTIAVFQNDEDSPALVHCNVCRLAICDTAA
jgi:hypothetical protein